MQKRRWLKYVVEFSRGESPCSVMWMLKFHSSVRSSDRSAQQAMGPDVDWTMVSSIP